MDATSAINPFPGFRLCNDSQAEYDRSMRGLTALISKLPFLGAQTLIISTHNIPESSPLTNDEFGAEVVRTVRQLADTAARVGVTLQLRPARKNFRGWTYAASAHFVDTTVNHPNLKLAPSLSLLLRQNNSAATASALHDICERHTRSLLLVAGYTNDEAGTLVSDNAEVTKIQAIADLQVTRKVLAAARSRNLTVVFDASYTSVDNELSDFDRLSYIEAEMNVGC